MSVPDSAPLVIASAPNGAYKTRKDHHQLPVSAAQLAVTAAAVLQAGAQMLHLHVRDADGRHTLDTGAYQAAVEAIRASTGDQLFIQVTSEAAGVYDAAEQRRAMHALHQAIAVDGISIAVREWIRAPADTHPARDSFHCFAEHGVLVQYILYCAEDVQRYHALREQGVIPNYGHSVLLVTGRHRRDERSIQNPLQQMLQPLGASAGQPVNWMVCAFGEQEFQCLTEAVTLGGHVRVGFENSTLLKSGQPAADNQQLITQLVESGNPTARPLADLRQAREILASAGPGFAL